MALRFAGGLYRVVEGYAGNLIRLRRVSDSAESDFGMTPGGWIDEAAVNAWIGGSSAKVKTLYNQDGSANHFTQGTAADQPDYNASTYPTARPSIKFARTSGTDGTLLTIADDGVMNFSGDMTWCFSYEPNAINVGVQTLFCKANGGSAGEFALHFSTSLADGKLVMDRPNIEAGAKSTTGMTVGAHQVVSGHITGTDVAHFLNGSANGTDTLAGGTATNTVLQLGAGNFSAGTQQDPLRGYMRAVMLWDSYEAAARADAEAMMRNETPKPPTTKILRGAVLRRYTAQSIPNNAWTGLSWELCDYDSDGFFSRSAPTRITIPSIGSRMIAELFGGIRWQNVLSGWRMSYCGKGGTAAWPGAPGLFTHGAGAAMNTINHWRSGPVLVEPGDYFENFVLQDSGGAINAEANAQTFFGIQLRAIEA